MGNRGQYIILLLAISFSFLSWLVNRLREQAAINRIKQERARQRQEALRTGRGVESAAQRQQSNKPQQPSSRRPDLQALAQQRQAQLRALRQQQLARLKQQTQRPVAAKSRSASSAQNRASEREIYDGVRTRVNRVIDGDTIEVDIYDPEKETLTTSIRLLGIDTPEMERGETPEMPWAQEAKDRVQSLVEGRMVTLKLAPNVVRGHYGRVLAYVLMENSISLNELLVREGLAKAREHSLRAVEKQAKDRGIGIWSRPVDARTQRLTSQQQRTHRTTAVRGPVSRHPQRARQPQRTSQRSPQGSTRGNLAAYLQKQAAKEKQRWAKERANARKGRLLKDTHEQQSSHYGQESSPTAESFSGKGMTMAQWRRAIVMSEMLAPPVALRAPSDGL